MPVFLHTLFLMSFSGVSVNTADLRLRRLLIDFFRAAALGKGLIFEGEKFSNLL